jgi:hypothetical protein
MHKEMNIIDELGKLDLYFISNSFNEGLQRLTRIWDEIPEPKEMTPNAYLLIEYAVVLSMKIGDLDLAQIWASKATAFADVRHDMGEAEFLIGKVAFERGETEVAKKQFLTAFEKSEGRALEGQDPKYKRLIGKH